MLYIYMSRSRIRPRWIDIRPGPSLASWGAYIYIHTYIYTHIYICIYIYIYRFLTRPLWTGSRPGPNSASLGAPRRRIGPRAP